MDELAPQVEDAVARPGLFPEIGGGVPGLRGRHRRVAGASELAPIEREEAGPGAVEMGGDVDQVGVHGEVSEAAAVCQQRLAGIAVGPVLADRVLDGLAAERVLELRGEQGDTVQEQHQVEALLVFEAVADLADNGEEVRRVQPPRLLVEPAGRGEIDEPEAAAHVLHPGAQHVEGAASRDLRRQPFEEPLLHLDPVVFGQPLPLLRLRSQQEVHDVAGQQAQGSVVVPGQALVIAAGLHPPGAQGRRGFPRQGFAPGQLPLDPAQQGRLDGVLEGSFRDLGIHMPPPRVVAASGSRLGVDGASSTSSTASAQ